MAHATIIMDDIKLIQFESKLQKPPEGKQFPLEALQWQFKKKLSH